MSPALICLLCVISSIAHVVYTAPAPAVESYSMEDSSYIPPSGDESMSALHHDSMTVEESAINSLEMSNEVLDNADTTAAANQEIDPPISSSGEHPSVLNKVFNKAGQFSTKIEKTVGIVHTKVNDWTRRINKFCFQLFGYNNWNGGGGNGYGGYGNGGNNMLNGGYNSLNGGYNSNGGYNQNGGSIVSAYYSMLPIYEQGRAAMYKVSDFAGRIASRLFLGSDTGARRPRARGRYQSRSRSRARVSRKRAPPRRPPPMTPVPMPMYQDNFDTSPDY